MIPGKKGMGKMNENGELFANFYASYDLVIGGTNMSPSNMGISRLKNRKPKRSYMFL